MSRRVFIYSLLMNIAIFYANILKWFLMLGLLWAFPCPLNFFFFAFILDWMNSFVLCFSFFFLEISWAVYSNTLECFVKFIYIIRTWNLNLDIFLSSKSYIEIPFIIPLIAIYRSLLKTHITVTLIQLTSLNISSLHFSLLLSFYTEVHSLVAKMATADIYW